MGISPKRIRPERNFISQPLHAHAVCHWEECRGKYAEVLHGAKSGLKVITPVSVKSENKFVFCEMYTF